MKNVSGKGFLVCTKYTLGLLIGVSIIYSFAVMPLMAKYGKIACNNEALASTNALMSQIEEANSNLAEGEEPTSINDIGVYDTQYTLCLRAKGL